MGLQASNNSPFRNFLHSMSQEESTDFRLTPVACAAGALELGVASRANLYLIKQESFMINTITQETWSGFVTASGVLEMTCKILAVIKSEQIPYGRAVVEIAVGL